MTKRKREDNKQRFGCIYLLTNLITLMCYVGQSVNFKGRMNAHKNSKKNFYLSRSIQKNGWHNFKVEILIDNVPEEDLDHLEDHYIDVKDTLYPYGYNLTKGGGGTRGYKHTDEAREKMSQAQIRRRANRDQFGCVSFYKNRKKYQVIGPYPESKHIGYYFTKEKAEEALKHYLKTGECIDSDRTQRKKGMGTIRKTKNGKRYQAAYKKNKKFKSKTFDTPEQCEEWLKLELKLVI
jgi:group I intron endonuclease